ncbi:hypothetical protein D0Z07_0716 [Hyphodiscus hymeniophilus]|uniref:DUF7896 domain-containing protein n=1 Tax=Hyphodiscus hymeniophilus TaxID=353542 RepID=A0A9P6VS82_9HELO|nr:hypothetical protein D0Z07_0716 [Hyphodiscus hymeniophilus]
MSNLRIDTHINFDHHQQQQQQQQQSGELELLLAQQAEIQARIASLSSNGLNHRSPIHKQHQQPLRRSHSNVPRSISSSGTSMARHRSSDRIEAPLRTRALSQQSAHSMARTNSRASASARATGNLPFTQTGNMPPPLLTDSRRENSVEAWANLDQPFNSYTFSHQPAPMQRSSSQRKPELEQVPELDSLPGDSVADYLQRTGLTGTPLLQLPVSPMTIPNHRFSAGSRQSYNIPTPTTPTSESLTTATTLTSNMSRQNSLCNEPLLEGIQMMKFNSNTSLSTDINAVDHTLYDQFTPHSSRHRRCSSNEEQSQLLTGAGGASYDSQFSHSFSAVEANDAQFHSSGSIFGEKMEKSESNESISSSSSTASSRSKQRLQAQIAAARPLMPKGGSEDHAMSRESSSQSMTRLDSKGGSQDKIAISKPTYQRPKHDRVYCRQCDDHAEGFRGEHELRRHQDRQHKLMVKKWICIQSSQSPPDVKPVVPLHKCKACTTQKKRYGAYYNAAAHLRRAHFRPKATKGRAKTSKMEDTQKRGGKAGGDWPTMADLKSWMREVEEPATEYPLTSAQQQEANESDDDDPFDFDEHFPSNNMNTISSGSFDTPFAISDASFNIYPSPISSELFNMQNMQPDLSSPHQVIGSSSMNFTSSQSSFDNFPTSSNFQNDPLAFLDSSSLPNHIPLQNNYDDQFGLVDAVNFSYV